MSSDEAYGAFLDQANQDTGTSKEDSITTTAMNTKSVDTEVPHQLQNIKQYYTSEVDEPFEPVSLKWNGSKLPTENEFKEIIQHDAGISTLGLREFDSRGQYKEIVEALDSVGEGESRVYRVEHGRSRAEYYIFRLDKSGQRIVGLKAKAVET